MPATLSMRDGSQQTLRTGAVSQEKGQSARWM